MNTTLLPMIVKFIKKEHIDLLISKDNSNEFWLDNKFGSITVKFKINNPKHEILFDVYSPEYFVHLKEETIKDVERLEYLAEEHRRWKLAEIIEDIWLILDQIKLWAIQNNFNVVEKELI